MPIKKIAILLVLPLRRLVFDQSSPVQLVSESRGVGSMRITEQKDGWTEIHVSNIGFSCIFLYYIFSRGHCYITCFLSFINILPKFSHVFLHILKSLKNSYLSLFLSYIPVQPLMLFLFFLFIPIFL